MGCAKTDEWTTLTEGEREMIRRATVTGRRIPGDAIYLEGDPGKGVYRVESGLVGIRKTDAEGNSVLLRLVGPGETFGYRPLIADEAHRTSAETIEAAAVSFVDKGAFLAVFERNPAFAALVLKRVAKSLGEAEDRIFENATLPLRARLARFLVELTAREVGARRCAPARVEIPFSRQTLASFLCATPESVSRTIRRMENDGVAQFSGRAVSVPRIESLYRESGLALAA
jgi:CRP/FNR family transcriptional regulator